MALAAISLFLSIEGGTNTSEGPGWVGQGGALTYDVCHAEAENLIFQIIWETILHQKTCIKTPGQRIEVILTRHDPLAHQLLPRASLLELQLQHCTTAERGERRKPISARNNRRDIFKCILFSSLDAKALVSSRRKRPPPHPAALPCCNCRSGPQQSGFRRLLQPGGEEVAQGLGRVIKIHKARPVSQFFLEHQLLSKPLILKNKQRETPADSPPINTEWHPSC